MILLIYIICNDLELVTDSISLRYCIQNTYSIRNHRWREQEFVECFHPLIFLCWRLGSNMIGSVLSAYVENIVVSF